MKFLKLIIILCIIICSTVLLNACSHMKEDNELQLGKIGIIGM